MSDLWTPEDPNSPTIWTPNQHTPVPDALHQVEEYIKTKGNIYHFFDKHVYIEDATTNQIIKYQFWNHLKFLVWAIQHYAKIIIIKCKQIGVSWTFGGIAYHDCYKTAATILEISAGQLEASMLLKKSRVIRSYLPKYLQMETLSDGAELISFKIPDSRIIALPSTKGAGLGQTASRVILDENEFHDNAEDNYGNVKPTVDAGAPCDICSTIDGTRVDTHFRKLLEEALSGKNGYYPIFFNCFVRPGRNEQWYIETERDYPQKWQMKKNYPRTMEEALSPITGKAVFDPEIMMKLIKECTKPEDIQQGIIYIFMRPKVGVYYMSGWDLAEGVGEANSVGWIEGSDGLHRELCAIIVSNIVHIDTFSFMAKELLKDYFNPMVICGADAYGQRFMDNLVAFRYPKELIYASPSLRSKGKLGYQEDEITQQKDVLELEASVRAGLKIRYKPALMEMLSYQYKAGKKGSVIEPAEGAMNDMVMAAVKATFGFKHFKPTEPVKVQSFY